MSTKHLPPKPDFGYVTPEMRLLKDCIHKDQFDRWYSTHIEPLFENAVEVRSRTQKWWFIAEKDDDLYTALLINIKPIKEDTTEEFLREFVDIIEDRNLSIIEIDELVRRARKLLEDK